MFPATTYTKMQCVLLFSVTLCSTYIDPMSSDTKIPSCMVGQILIASLVAIHNRHKEVVWDYYNKQ